MSYLENDLELIDQAKAGNSNAFGNLYRLHQSRVRAAVRSYVKDQDEADDLVQVVFMKAFQGLQRFRGESAFTTWLTRIALNVGLSHLRSKQSLQKRMETVEQQMPEPILLTTPEDLMIKKEQRQILNKSIQSLPELHRRALWLRHMQDLSYREIGRELNVPLGSVKSWLFRGRHQLKCELEKLRTLAI